MNEKLMEEFEKKSYELGITKMELEVKEKELTVANGEMWNMRCKEEAKLEREIQMERLAYFKNLNAGNISPIIK